MNRKLAGDLLTALRRAWHGAELCRSRLLAINAQAPRIGNDVVDLRGEAGHDVDYYAWEATRVINIAKRVVSSQMRGHREVSASLDRLTEQSPTLNAFRNAVTHPEDNRAGDDLAYSLAAVRFLPGGRVEYVMDPRYSTHALLNDLVDATETALLTLATPDDGPMSRFTYGRGSDRTEG